MQKFKNKLESILNDKILTDEEKHTELCFLLSKMAYDCKIPLVYSDTYKEENKEMIELFEHISGEANKLNGVSNG